MPKNKTERVEGEITVSLSREEAEAALRTLTDAHGYFEPEKCSTCRAEAKLRHALANPGGQNRG